jgi:hypothetical protein
MQDQRSAWDRRNRRVAPASRARSSRRSSGTPLASSWSARVHTYSAGIELRGVRREVVHVKAGMAGQERADLATAMDRAAIPQQVNGTAEMAEQMLEEGADIEAGEISRPTPEVERQASPSWRHGEAAADRQAIVAVAVAQARCLPAGRPRAADVGKNVGIARHAPAGARGKQAVVRQQRPAWRGHKGGEPLQQLQRVHQERRRAVAPGRINDTSVGARAQVRPV